MIPPDLRAIADEGAARAAGARVVCLGCGRTAVGLQGDPTDIAPSLHCGERPPWVCGDCGETCAMASLCSCWTSLEGLPLADVKALLALGDLSVSAPAKDEAS